MQAKRHHLAAMATAAVMGLGAVGSANALTINLINNGGVDVGTDAYTGFAAAAYYWESVLTDNVTINLRVGFSVLAETTLGQASSTSGTKTQGSWRSALTADATSVLDGIATSNLAAFSATNVRLNTALQKALGLYTGTATATDGTITFNSLRAFDFDTRNGFQVTGSDFVSVAVHEIGHVLGFTSAVASGSTNNSTPSNTDMFRYKDGASNFTWGGDPYFSIDGGASQLFGRSGFSSGADGFQTSHWKEGLRIHDGVSCTQLLEPQIGVMDPTGGLCQQGIVTAQDLGLFDAIGWNLSFNALQTPGYAYNTAQIMQGYLDSLAPVPEPGTWAMLVAGLGLVGASARRNNRRAAVVKG
ncbi:MAG: NF038122 family metalloprotease [Rubrivivax sp.]